MNIRSMGCNNCACEDSGIYSYEAWLRTQLANHSLAWFLRTVSITPKLRDLHYYCAIRKCMFRALNIYKYLATLMY